MTAKTRVYLDYAAATPLDPQVAAAMVPFASDQFANPSSLYAEGRATKLALETARKRVAKVLGARAGEIVFTAGATEALNIAIQGVHNNYPQAVILALASEHQAVLETVQAIGGGLIPVKKNGRVNREQLEKLIDNNTVMLCMAQAGSELGIIQPLAEIAEIIKKIRVERRRQRNELPLYLLSDSSAAAGHLSLQVSRLGVDLLVINGAKLYGPKQSGGLYVRSGTQLKPVNFGGGQERGLRSGTEAVGQAVGLATALELADEKRSAEERRLVDLRRDLLAQLQQLPGFVLNNPQHSLPDIINFQLAGVSGEDLVYKLDAAGFAVATGAACSASSDQPSSALLAIGLTPEQANSSLRLSLGRSTTAAQLGQFVAVLRQILET